MNNSLIQTFFNLKANPKYCVWLDPLWGIPYMLYAPYASLYMIAMGVTKAQIGMILTISLLVQAVSSLASGIITDHLGRRKTTFIFDLLSWSLPCLLWAIAKDVRFFYVAAVFNSLLRISSTSYSCLLVEDADEKKIGHIYTLLNVAMHLSVFLSPIAGVLINHYTLIPTVRILYFFAFLSMTLKFSILFIKSTETKTGEIRLEESRDKSMLKSLLECGPVFLQILNTRRTLLIMGIHLLITAATNVNGVFWVPYVEEVMHVEAQWISLMPFIKSFVQLLVLFLILPRIDISNPRKPLMVGFISYILSFLVLAFAPGGIITALICAAIEAFALGHIVPTSDGLLVLNVNPKERARILGIVYAVIILGASPFGGIAGVLSEMQPLLPFIMLIVLLCIASILVLFFTKKEKTS